MPFKMPYRIVIDIPQDESNDNLVMASSYTLGYAKLLLDKMSDAIESATKLTIIDSEGRNPLPINQLTPQLLLSDHPF